MCKKFCKFADTEFVDYHCVLTQYFGIMSSVRSIDTNRMRVCLVHNNLELDHYIKNKDEYLISWDNYIIDSPIIDIVKLYKTVYLNMDFSEPLKKYIEKFPLNDQEKKLLIIMLVMPDEIKLTNDELENVRTVRCYLDYIFKTENLVKQFYND